MFLRSYGTDAYLDRIREQTHSPCKTQSAAGRRVHDAGLRLWRLIWKPLEPSRDLAASLTRRLSLAVSPRLTTSRGRHQASLTARSPRVHHFLHFPQLWRPVWRGWRAGGTGGAPGTAEAVEPPSSANGRTIIYSPQLTRSSKCLT